MEGIKIQHLASSEIASSQEKKQLDAKRYSLNAKISVDGLFIEIGQVPSSVLAKQLGVELDERSYVSVGPDMATNVPGVLAAGDLASQKGVILFRQFITSAADGARAAASVYQYLTNKTTTPSWGKR